MVKSRIKHGGRKSGTPNKTTKQMREYVEILVADKIDMISKDIDSLPPYKRLDIICRLLQYCLPKPLPQDTPIDKVEFIITKGKTIL